jgi:TolB-like protein
VWVVFIAFSRGCTPGSDERSDISHADAKKLKAIADQYRGSTHPGDIAKLGSQIAREFSDSAAQSTGRHAVLAIPFAASGNDPSAERLVDAAFAQTYGRLSVSHHGEIGLDEDALASDDPNAAVARGRATHSAYVVYGSVRSQASAQVLTVSVARVDDASIVWTQTYPVSTADPTKIAEEVNSKVPSSASDDD